MEKWEKVIEYSPGHLESHTQRLKVPGGWIYRYSDYHTHMGMVFVPEPKEVVWAGPM